MTNTKLRRVGVAGIAAAGMFLSAPAIAMADDGASYEDSSSSATAEGAWSTETESMVDGNGDASFSWQQSGAGQDGAWSNETSSQTGSQDGGSESGGGLLGGLLGM